MSIFERILDAATLEDAVLNQLKDWFPTYLREVERQKGLTVGHIAEPKGWHTTNTFFRWEEDQTPTVLVVSPGLTGDTPEREGDGTYRAGWGVAIVALVTADSQKNARNNAMVYAAAIRALMLQRPSLRGYLEGGRGTDWLDERYDDIAADEERTMSAARVAFRIEVGGVTTLNVGPVAPDPPDDPTDPWPPWPLAETVDATIEKED